MALRPQDEALLRQCESFRFGPQQSRIAWSLGSGPLVLLIHGWGGRGTQMAPLAQALATDGYRCVFFDAGGHGASRPERVGFHTLMEDAWRITDKVAEPVSAWIGHSAGALSMMRARSTRGIAADRYVCISAPRFPYVPIETMRQNAGANDDVLGYVKPYIGSMLESDWSALEQDSLAWEPEPGRKLLLIYDRDDPRVRHEDADSIAAKWPEAEVMKTAGYGHNKILTAPEVIARVRQFLGSV